MSTGNDKGINQSTLASLLGVSRTRISQIFKEDGCPSVKSGTKGKAVSVNAPEFFKWYLKRHVSRELAKFRTDQEATGTRDAEEIRLVAGKARKIEIEIQRLKQELIPVEDVKILLNEVAANYSMGLEALPGRLANDLAGMEKPAEIKERVFSEVRRIRKSTAGRLSEFRTSGGNSEEDGEDSGCATSKNGGPVGGRKKDPAKRKRRTGAVCK